jgi:hypothetical protein
MSSAFSAPLTKTFAAPKAEELVDVELLEDWKRKVILILRLRGYWWPADRNVDWGLFKLSVMCNHDNRLARH